MQGAALCVCVSPSPDAMLTALRRAFTQMLTDPKLWRLLLGSLLLALVGFLVLWGLLGGALYLLAQHFERFRSWLEWGGAVVSFIAALFLFPTTFLLTQSFFQEAVASRVEAKYYPLLPPAQGPPLRTSIARGLKFFSIMLALNLGAAPLFLGLTVLMGSGAAVYAVMNGFLSGREYYEVVALRRLPGAEVDAARRAQGMRVFLTGLTITLLGLVPVVNLLMPILGTAAMVHVFHRRSPG